MECGWFVGEEPVVDWPPEHMYILSEWHTIVGILTKQFRAKALTYNQYTDIIQNMGIIDGSW